jgi:hypothetical protein
VQNISRLLPNQMMIVPVTDDILQHYLEPKQINRLPTQPRLSISLPHATRLPQSYTGAIERLGESLLQVFTFSGLSSIEEVYHDNGYTTNRIKDQ